MADDWLLIERLLRVIDEGRRTATYKLALLLALIDGAAASDGATELPTRSIAAEVRPGSPEAQLAKFTDEQLAAELQRRKWVMEP